ncbi:MAG TPA: transposase [Ktedonobacteraceae bacterium]|nr:transposase [Ktedonobacteraceae bacterium]
MLRAYKYRLYPNKKQAEKLQWVLDRNRELYNAALQERRDAYCMAHISIGYNQQAAQLPEIKEIREEYAGIHSQVLQDTLRRVDKAFNAFFRRVKNGEKAGYPRFQHYGRYDSFTFPQSGFSLTEENRVCLSKIGTIKGKFPRGKKANPPQGTMKTCTVKREGHHWYVIFTCEVEQELVYHESEEAVGIDLGLLHFATLSDGRTIENPRHLRTSEQKLKKLQEVLSRKKRGSKRRRKAAQVVGKNHRHIACQRKDFQHKEARKLVKSYQSIVFEKLHPANMSRRPRPKQDEATGQYVPNGASAKAGLNKSILDASWGQFQQLCQNKAECAGSRVLFVSPNYTSQMCSGCGVIARKELNERWHSCSCGCSLDRDHNAAINIKRAGIAVLKKEAQARTEPSEDAPLRSPRLEPWGVVTNFRPKTQKNYNGASFKLA